MWNTDLTRTDGLQLQAISLLRLPLIAAVVMIHSAVGNVVVGGVCAADGVSCRAYRLAEALFVEGFGRMAVPVLFFFSGYLFFHGGSFTAGVYRGKLLRRVHSLLVPYVFWNLLTVALTFMAQTFMGGMTSGMRKPVAGYSAADWLACFWDVDGTEMPMCYPLWFVRNLMLLAVASPLLYVVLRRAGAVFTGVVGALWLTGVTGVSNFCPWSLEGLAFFSWGAYYGVRGRSFLASFGRLDLKAVAAAYLLMVAASAVLRLNGLDERCLLQRAAIPLGLISAVCAAAGMVSAGRGAACIRLSSASFFVYAYHPMPALLVLKVWVMVLPVSDFTMTLGLFAVPVMLVAVGVALHAVSARLLPTFTAVITGGRGMN